MRSRLVRGRDRFTSTYFEWLISQVLTFSIRIAILGTGLITKSRNRLNLRKTFTCELKVSSK